MEESLRHMGAEELARRLEQRLEQETAAKRRQETIRNASLRTPWEAAHPITQTKLDEAHRELEAASEARSWLDKHGLLTPTLEREVDTITTIYAQIVGALRRLAEQQGLEAQTGADCLEEGDDDADEAENYPPN